MAGKVLESPRRDRSLNTLTIVLLVAAFILTLAGFLMAFLIIPPVGGANVNGAVLVGNVTVTQVMLISQKIFFFHMPVALVSFCALALGAFYALRFLMTRSARYDTCSKISLEISLLFVVLTMITGEMWTRFEWGVWWTWEPRLTTYLILMIIVIAYSLLRNSIEDPEKQGVYASVIAIIAFIDVPICFMVTRLIPSSVHPVVLREGGMTPEMGLCVAIITLGMLALGFVLYRLRLRQVRVTERIKALQEALYEDD